MPLEAFCLLRMTLQDQFGNIDIYVFDQLLRGRIAPGMRVFDAGCGGGRNLVYLLRNGLRRLRQRRLIANADGAGASAGGVHWRPDAPT